MNVYMYLYVRKHTVFIAIWFYQLSSFASNNLWIFSSIQSIHSKDFSDDIFNRDFESDHERKIVLFRSYMYL